MLIDNPCVLVVDALEETREVLQTILERRGVRIFAARRADEGLRLAREHQPNVIVLDIESETDRPEAVGDLDREARSRQTPLVLLGGRRRAADDGPQGEFVPKPYHYGPLIRRIEELLDRADTAVA